jgi:hypothetical protein
VAVPVRGQDKPADAGATLQAFKAALEAGDLKKTADLTAGPAGAALRQLAEPYAKAKAASDRLDKALAARPALGWRNPFAAGLTPLEGAQLEVVEIGQEGPITVARVKYGPRGQGPEEVLGVRKEGDAWRVDLPGELARTLHPLGVKDRLAKRRQGLDKLADIIGTLATEIESAKLTTREGVVLRLVELTGGANLAELLGG